MKRNRGFTLFELIAVLAILAILATIATPKIFKTINNSKRVTCYLNRDEIVRNYHLQRVLKPQLSFDEYFQSVNNYFEKDVSCPSGANYTYDDNKVICSVHGFLYVEINVDEYIYYPFFDTNFDEELIEEVIYHEHDNWQFSQYNGDTYYTNTTTDQNRFFLENKLESYKIVTNAILEGNNGYGILFESITDDDANDSGYIFQFDRGYTYHGVDGMFIFREREDGNEDALTNPMCEIDPNDVIDNFSSIEDTYWHEEHEIIVEVIKISDTQKSVKVYIDDIEITRNLDEPLLTTIFTGEKMYFGFRTWGSSKVYIKDVRIDKIN